MKDIQQNRVFEVLRDKYWIVEWETVSLCSWGVALRKVKALYVIQKSCSDEIKVLQSEYLSTVLHPPGVLTAEILNNDNGQTVTWSGEDKSSLLAYITDK